MKRWLVTLLLGAFAAFAAQAAPLFKQGQNYTVVKQIGTEKPQVMEFFSYLCPHCYQFEPIVDGMKKKAPEGTEFKQVPIASLGGKAGPLLQRAFAVAQLLEVSDKMTPVLFESVQVERKLPKSEADIKKLFVDNGVDGKLFDEAWSNFQIEGMINEYNLLTESYKVYGVPAFIINGKYQVRLEGLRGSDAQQKMDYLYQLVNYLLAKTEPSAKPVAVNPSSIKTLNAQQAETASHHS
ncbi:thiol:disulfide interchange protein DsbA/DsbL [Dongshaea marina]|uniref:thiol:disulfide interchange protein DsbA/DsbL n=1 Tax=Dongshaea marina TaxID=2047966 RepID=UPI000D3E8BA3|nr:thiol:disulfide interchange protein DsbA/DsbL [Dongshaea marina]